MPEPDTTPLVVRSVAPAASTIFVDPTRNIIAIFDDQLVGSSVTAASFVVRDASNQPASGNLTSFPSSIMFDPQNALAFGATHMVTLSGIRNLSGLPLASDFVWSFAVIPEGTGTWQPVSTTSAPSARDLHAAVWTGNKMIVWGGDGCAQTCAGLWGRYTP